jgi:type IV pilus assembly protein PilM
MNYPKVSENKIPAQPANKPSALSPLTLLFSFVKNILASTQSVIGIDAGSSAVKIALLQKTASGHVIADYIIRSIPQGIKDNPPERKRFIQEWLKGFVADSRIKTNLCRAAVWGKGIHIFSLAVPVLNKKNLRGVVSMELRKRLPFQLNIDTIMFDFFVTGQARDEKGLNVLQVTAIACDRLMLEEQIQFIKEAGLRPVALNIIADCLGNLLSLCLNKPQQENTVVLLDMGAKSSTLNFYVGGFLRFSREMPIGGDQLTHALTRTIPSATGQININVEEAEKIKRQCGIPLENEAKTEFLTDFGVVLGEQISAMLRTTLERLIMEISRTLNYYTATFKAPAITELFITGGSSRLKNLNKFFLDNLKELKKVEGLNILKAVKGWKDTDISRQEMVMEQAAPHLAAVFGLCAGSGGKANFLPTKERLEQKAIFLNFILKISFPIILALSLTYYCLTYVGALRYKEMIKKTEAQMADLEPTAKKAREYLETKIKLEQRKTLLQEAAGSRQPKWFELLKELSTITPDEVVLYKITTVDEKEPKGLRLEGRASSQYTVVDVEIMQYVLALEESPYFAQAQLVSSSPDMYSPVPAADFEIICQLVY